MFRDREELRLHRIRRQLQVDDPAFVAGFERDVGRLLRGALPAPRDTNVRTQGRVWTVVMVATIVLGLLQLADGVVGGAAFMGVIAIGAYLARRYGLPSARQV